MAAKDPKGTDEYLAVRAIETEDLAGAAFAANVVQYVCSAVGAPVAARRGVA